MLLHNSVTLFMFYNVHYAIIMMLGLDHQFTLTLEDRKAECTVRRAPLPDVEYQVKIRESREK